ncbi:hypothetical protein EFM7_1302 [Enterococcus faecalis M7]|nr:hypothetical protein EFM7_1302 [Enterococcus faecalis M7]
MTQLALRSPCTVHHLLCHFAPVVVIRANDTTCPSVTLYCSSSTLSLRASRSDSQQKALH